MKIDKVMVNPACQGPVQHIVTWECAKCGQSNELKKFVSTLPPEEVRCAHCGVLEIYEYDPGMDHYDGASMESLLSLESTILRKVAANQEACIVTLGQDFLFAVNAYFANRWKDVES